MGPFASPSRWWRIICGDSGQAARQVHHRTGPAARRQQATISRVSRALGYEGYPDLKLSVAEGARPKNAYVNIPVEIDGFWRQPDPDQRQVGEPPDVGLAGTQRMLDAHRLEQAVEALSKARKIIFVGVGGGAAICDEAAHLFMKAGFDSASYRGGYTQTIVASTLQAGDVMVGVSHTGSTLTVADAMQQARENGAATIAITSDRQSDVAAAGDNASSPGGRRNRWCHCTVIFWREAEPALPH